jgi:hypothetical protein
MLGGLAERQYAELRARQTEASPIPNSRASPVAVLSVRSFEAAARSLNIAPSRAPVYNDVEIETATIALGREPEKPLLS